MPAPAQTTRRHFLQQCSAVGTALGFPTFIPGTALGKNGAVAPSNRTTLALIGCGGRGTDVVKNFLHDERVQVMAVCDVEKESDRYNKGIIKKAGTLGREPARRLVDKSYGTQSCAVHEDFREVLSRKDVDAVQIATPDHWHALMAVAAARAGKHIYCEKPLSLTVAQGRFMSDVVRQSKVVWQTGSQQRSDIHFRMACEYVRNGKIGKLKQIRVGLASDNRDNNGCAAQTAPTPVPEGLNYDFWLGPAPDAPFCPARLHSNWRWFFDYSGGNITDFGAHHFDIVQWALGKDESGPVEFFDLKATWPAPGSLYSTAPNFSFAYRYEDGTTVCVADKQDFGSGILFEGEEGSVLSMRGKLEIKPDALRKPLAENDVRLYESKDHFRNFIDGIQNGAKTAAPIEYAHRSITIAHLANIALRLNRAKLSWDPAKEQVLDDAEAAAMLTRPMRGPWQLV
ncbi:Gfo/Idh/MocA family protein [Prosthecobacter vanneervenii]|uniref:Putative dehydrogenase n=1 Tax=Prosthecobacter vanneervenii TaxID=48466 RepID=A0A7W7YD62_9BACT|nr:Gfo/Idh/MocA family oxidoreductase [Prosthecobacter vanneervenii]MBB5033985.1 putative dehydrogenase [Prosthecobacter vanneervenii]